MAALVIALWCWGFISVLAQAIWRAVARDALHKLGVALPAWWSTEMLETLTLVSDNRARLPSGGGRLYRIGAVIFWNRTAFIVLLFTALMVVAFAARLRQARQVV